MNAAAAAIYLDDPTRYLGEVVRVSRGSVLDGRLRLEAVEELHDLLKNLEKQVRLRDVPALTAPERLRLLRTCEAAKDELARAAMPRKRVPDVQ